MKITTTPVAMNVISYKEAEKLVAWFLGLSVYETLVADMHSGNAEWGNDTVHRCDVEPEANWVRSNHLKALGAVREQKGVMWSWELAAVLNEAGKAGLIPLGPMLIEVCW